ncbi:MAG: ribonuclease Z, partial [Prevotellaceae bacterium]|nr:ribonuclease Z [Prevotellaceae bacterium]
SALPTTRHFPASQVVDVRGKLFMIDCGEGAQMQMRKARLKFSRLKAIFISHLHGDHCFGLMGLVSTLNLLGRKEELHVYGPEGLEELFAPLVTYFNQEMSYPVLFHVFGNKEPALLYEDRSFTVTTIPLCHRLPCCGFLFAEKRRPNHLVREMADFYHIPVQQLNLIREGADYVTPDGTVVPNARLTVPSAPPRRYAYCSDTLCIPSVVEQVRGVDLLFHEATFATAEEARAAQTFHTTAAQAARIAADAGVKRLLIGHFSARYVDESLLLEEAKAIFPQTGLAEEFLCVPI